jgi:hypothetical protein
MKFYHDYAANRKKPNQQDQTNRPQPRIAGYS